MGEIYDPIGTFRCKKKARKVELNLGIYFPVMRNEQGQPNKVKLKKPKLFTIKSNLLPAVLIIIRPKKQAYRRDEEEDINEDLRQLEDHRQVMVDVMARKGESIQEPIKDIESFSKNVCKKELSDDSEIKHIAVIVFHSNHRKKRIKKCFESFWKLRTKELEENRNTPRNIDLDFGTYYSGHCAKDIGVRPETSGGSILVGV